MCIYRAKQLPRLLYQSFIILLIVFWSCCQEDEEQSIILPLSDVAQHKLVYTTASDSTCGYNTPTKYCKAVNSEDGLLGGACDEQVCDQKCIWRDKVLDRKPR